MSTHTPGPWVAYQRQDMQSGTGLASWRIHSAGAGPIAEAHCDSEQNTTAKQYANAAANARLIAAAPELLEALKLAYCQLDPGCELETRVRDLIAKAEGRS